MRNKITNIYAGIAGIAMATAMCGCSSEAPFDGEGEGTVYLRTVVNSITTRADEASDGIDYDYSANCIVSISRTGAGEGKDGLIYQKKGLASVDPIITLRAGSYIAEACSGEPVAASFTQKYYEGSNAFTITKGDVSNVVVNCKIQNAIVSVDISNEELLKMIGDDFKVTVTNNSHENGSLEFTRTNMADAKGYFMLADGETELQYTISGTKKDGTPIEKKERKIENVERSHHYILKLSYIPKDENDIGGFDSSHIQIEIEDEDPANSKETDTSLLPTEPTITGVGFDITGTLDFTNENEIPEDLAVMVCAIGKNQKNGLNEVSVSSSSIPALGTAISFDMGANTNALDEAIEWLAPEYDADKNVSTAFILFKKEFIKTLQGEHAITINVKDINGKAAECNLSIKR